MCPALREQLLPVDWGQREHLLIATSTLGCFWKNLDKVNNETVLHVPKNCVLREAEIPTQPRNKPTSILGSKQAACRGLRQIRWEQPWKVQNTGRLDIFSGYSWSIKSLCVHLCFHTTGMRQRLQTSYDLGLKGQWRAVNDTMIKSRFQLGHGCELDWLMLIFLSLTRDMSSICRQVNVQSSHIS